MAASAADSTELSTILWNQCPRSVESALENRSDIHDSSGTHEQRHQSEHESIDCGQGWGAPTGTAADEELLFKQQRLGNYGADTAGAGELGQGDDQLHREKKQVTHRQSRLSKTPFSTRLLAYGASRYNLRIRTPQARRD